MALAHSSQIITCNFGRNVHVKVTKLTAIKPVMKHVPGKCKVSQVSQEPAVRRSGNYKPCIWDYNFIQSLGSDSTGEGFNARALELRNDVELMLKNVVEPLDKLELIDNLQRLALGYHFDQEIKCALKNIYNDDQTNTDKWEKNLHATALKFRLLREHGYHASSEVFKGFTENGRFKESLGEDVKGILSLYEALYYSTEGESLLEEACSFTSKILEEGVKNIDDSDLAMQVRHALELPLQWRIPRFDARWYMDIYERRSDMIPTVLKFAKIDFNIVQRSNQEELKEVSRWWNRTGLGHNLDFIRERLAASFLWTLALSCKPQHEYFRVQTTKAIQLITTLDDVYDVYGTLDELELFTSVTERWDINAMTELPHYMKLCLLSLYNHVNETVYDILREQNLDVLPQIKKSWIDLLKHYLVEARWYHSGYKPSFEEYLRNARVSITGPMIAIQSYILTSNPIRKEATEFIEGLPEIVSLASEIFRLADDYGTSSNELKRGDVPKSIQCYMMDTGVSEEVARQRMKDLMKKKWARMIKCRFSDHIPLDWESVEIIINLVRMSHCMYNAGDDGYGVEDGLAKDRLFSVFTEPIPLLQDTVTNDKD